MFENTTLFTKQLKTHIRAYLIFIAAFFLS